MNKAWVTEEYQAFLYLADVVGRRLLSSDVLEQFRSRSCAREARSPGTRATVALVKFAVHELAQRLHQDGDDDFIIPEHAKISRQGHVGGVQL